MISLDTRLRRLEDGMPGQGDDGHVFTVDIATDPPRYWIDGIEVSATEYLRRVRPGPFVVDVGPAEDDPILEASRRRSWRITEQGKEHTMPKQQATEGARPPCH